MFGLPREEAVNLIPCAICSAPFDPATLPAHVYDPNQTFLLFSQRASICPSCFAEELAKRTRPDPTTFGDVGSAWPAQIVYEVNDRANDNFSSSQIGKPASFHKRASSLASFSSSAYSQAASFAGTNHRRAASNFNLLTSNAPLKRESRSYDVLRRHDSLKESMASTETIRHRPSTSIGQSTITQKTSPDLTVLSRRTTPEIPQRVASRNHSRAQTIQSSPDLSRRSQEKSIVSHRPSAEAVRKSADNVRRKVSFHKGGPIAQSFNPQSPPVHAIAPRPIEPAAVGPSSVRPPTVSGLSIPATNANESIDESRSHRLSALLGLSHPHSVLQNSGSSSFLSWSSWRIRRRQAREAREHRWQDRREQQRLKKLREERERGINLDLFCPHCQDVVTTQPKWRDGSCCLMYSTCLCMCTGPLCLCLLLPCASRQVLDVDGRCPTCSATLSTWNRRKNQLTILTWAASREAVNDQSAAHLAPRPRPQRNVERSASVRMPAQSSSNFVHYSRPRTATNALQVSRADALPLNTVAESINSTAAGRPRTMSSTQQTATASTARTSGGSPPTTNRSSPSTRMSGSGAGTSGSSHTGSSSQRTAISAGGASGANVSVSTGTTLVSSGFGAPTSTVYEEDASYTDEEQNNNSDEADVVATDFAAFLQDPVGQEYLHDNHAITHAALAQSVQVIVPQRLLDEIEMEEVGRAVG